MYMLLTGRAPFTGQSDSEVISKILNGEPNFKGLNINENAQNLIKWILSKKPHKRPSIAEIEEHAYFQQAEIREISDIKSRVQENTKKFKEKASELKSELERLQKQFDLPDLQ